MEIRAKALEIAIAILGPIGKEEIEKTNNDGNKVIEQYFWLVKDIRDFILLPGKFDELYFKKPQ